MLAHQPAQGLGTAALVALRTVCSVSSAIRMPLVSAAS
jgi:hypothetical protein